MARTYSLAIGLRFCGIVDELPRPASCGLNSSAISVCISRMTSVAILARLPQIRPSRHAISARLSRLTCHGGHGMPFVKANDLTIHYDLAGPAGAPVVMFANSLATSLQVWDPQAAALAGCRQQGSRREEITDSIVPPVARRTMPFPCE